MMTAEERAGVLYDAIAGVTSNDDLATLATHLEAHAREVFDACCMAECDYCCIEARNGERIQVAKKGHDWRHTDWDDVEPNEIHYCSAENLRDMWEARVT